MHTQLYNLNLNIGYRNIAMWCLPMHKNTSKFIYIKEKIRHEEAVYSVNVSIIADLYGSIILNYRQKKKK